MSTQASFDLWRGLSRIAHYSFEGASPDLPGAIPLAGSGHGPYDTEQPKQSRVPHGLG